MERITSKVLSTVKPILDNQIFTQVITIIVLFNIIKSVDTLPETLRSILVHPVTQVITLFIALYNITKDIKTAFIAGIVLVALYNLTFFVKENFEIMTTTTDTYPGCQNAKVSDLLALFNNDESALRRAMYELSVPLNVELTDDNAPYIATVFINHGKQVTEGCRPPSD
jgi:hypothetical protein